MDPQAFLDISTAVTKLRMYPYFDIANYILMCIIVREDNPVLPGNAIFSRKHPLSCWVASMLMCFAGSILGNLVVGESVLVPFKDHNSVLIATAVWYLLNYSPFDIVFKLCKFSPIKIVIYTLKEVQRANKVHHAVAYASKMYPGSYLAIVILGICKGAGYYYMRVFERLVRGVWVPASGELLQPSFVTKGSLAASIVFILERKEMISAPHPVIYFGVVIFFVYFRLSSLLLNIHDPFVPFENLFCSVFMGGMWDALKKAASKKPAESDPGNGNVKNKDTKKTD